MTAQTVSELYPRMWLKPEDLQGRSVAVKIIKVDIEDFRQRDGSTKIAAVLTFERASKRMICNKTQCLALVTILGTERLAEWPGHEVALAPAVAPNGRPTIEVRRAENGQ